MAFRSAVLPPQTVEWFEGKGHPSCIGCYTTVRPAESFGCTALIKRYRLIDSLDLRCTLTEYNVPREHLDQIAEKSLGRANDPIHPQVVKLLEGLY